MKWLKEYTEENEAESKFSIMALGLLQLVASIVGFLFVLSSVHIAYTLFNHDLLAWMNFNEISQIFLVIQYNYPLFVVPPVILIASVLIGYMAFSNFKKFHSMFTAED